MPCFSMYFCLADSIKFLLRSASDKCRSLEFRANELAATEALAGCKTKYSNIELEVFNNTKFLVFALFLFEILSIINT